MLTLLGMPSAANGNALSAALTPSQAASTVGSGQGCPGGQRGAAQHECMAAVLSVAFEEELELHSARGLKVVNDGAEGAIPPGCSYSFTSKAAIFNSNDDKAVGFGSSYQRVCVEDQVSPQGCPKGQRNAAQHECLAAVLSTMMARTPEVAAAVRMQQLKVVNDGADTTVPLGCSYSRHSKAALFNSNKAAGSGSDQYQLVCVEDEIAPVTVSVRLCEAMGLGNANRNAHRQVSLSAGPERNGYVHNESVLVQIFRDSFAPAAGAQPDLVFLPMVCGWEASREHSPADPAPRLGYFALAQSPWRSERGPRDDERRLITQGWPDRMVVMSTEVPAHKAEWDGLAPYTSVRVNPEADNSASASGWPKHSPAHGMTIPFHSDPPPLIVPEDRAALATFVGSCANEKGGRLSCQLMDECLKVSAKGECVFVSDQEDVGQQVYTGSRFALMPWTETMNRKDLFGALMQGSIPVLFDNTTFVDYWPFAPLQHFAVQIPPSAWTASGGVLQYLRDIPAAEVSRLLASVQRVRRRFYFPRTASLHQEGDAVDVIVHTIVEHFRGLLGIHAWHGGLPELP